MFYTDIEVALITAVMWILEIVEAVREHKYMDEEVRRKKKRPTDKSYTPFMRPMDDQSDYSDN